ncbi:Cytochrome P450 3A27 [Araneus ventricosus]|uniref:Cytochrome P450 3A27 n=1 Tax=Araneus ventricosus TaxID=182803 RepID=A0A4Y2RCF3_ARAVE|nr:Cytochrome P450 3A27 [Araneus ventricosus]
MLPIFKDCTEALLNHFRTFANEGKAVDVKRMYGAFSMDVIASSAFSTKIDSLNDPNNKFVQVAKTVFGQEASLLFLLFCKFTPEERAKRDPYSYIPFGAGPRNCVGMRFALMQIKVCLAHIIASFRVNRCPQTKVPLEFNMGQQGLLQPKEIVVQFEIRTDSRLLK